MAYLLLKWRLNVCFCFILYLKSAIDVCLYKNEITSLLNKFILVRFRMQMIQVLLFGLARGRNKLAFREAIECV